MAAPIDRFLIADSCISRVAHERCCTKVPYTLRFPIPRFLISTSRLRCLHPVQRPCRPRIPKQWDVGPHLAVNHIFFSERSHVTRWVCPRPNTVSHGRRLVILEPALPDPQISTVRIRPHDSWRRPKSKPGIRLAHLQLSVGAAASPYRSCPSSGPAVEIGGPRLQVEMHGRKNFSWRRAALPMAYKVAGCPQTGVLKRFFATYLTAAVQIP